MRTTREQRTNNARTAREQRMNNARAACANSHEQRANYEREQRRTHPRTARRARLARGSPRLSMPHSYSTFLVSNMIKVQMGVSSALFLFLCVNWFTACREGLVSGAAVGHRRVQQMQDLAKCGMARRLQQVLIGRNKTSSRRKAAHWSVDNRSPTASK